ncbi:hypothetical protein [Kribbella sp. NPDC051718]
MVSDQELPLEISEQQRPGEVLLKGPWNVTRRWSRIWRPDISHRQR